MFRAVKFDRYAQATFGLEAKTDPGSVFIDGIALVTRWLSGGPYSVCSDPVSSSWTNCISSPVTAWTLGSSVSTVWTIC